MSDARIRALAKEVANDLGNTTLDVECEHRGVQYVPKVDIEETDTPLLTVTMSGIRISRDNRTDWLYEFDIDVGVQHRVGPNADATMHFDKALRLCEQIADKYRHERTNLTDMGLANVAYGGDSGLPYLADHIHRLNQFTGVVRLTFQEWRS